MEDFLEYYTDKYESTFSEPFFCNRAKARSFVKRILKRLDKEEAKNVTEYAMDNWENIKSLLGITGNLTLNLLATYSFLDQFTAFSRDGMPINPKKRYIGGDKDEEFK